MRIVCLAIYLSALVLIPCVCFSDVTINISASPALPVQNLLNNPDFERGSVTPDGWTIVTGERWIFSFERIPTGGRHGAFLRIKSRIATIMSAGFMSQDVSVKPDTLYTAGAWVRLAGGQANLYIGHPNGTTSEATRSSWGLNPIVPDFVTYEQAGSPPSDEWFWLGKEFNTAKDQTTLLCRFGTYQEVTSVDYDDAFLGLAYTDLSLKVDGVNIRQVLVKNEAGKELWDSGILAAGTSTVEHVIQQVSTIARYEVVVTSADMKEIHKWYPETP
jgi:hypothetical protein